MVLLSCPAGEDPEKSGVWVCAQGARILSHSDFFVVEACVDSLSALRPRFGAIGAGFAIV